MGVHETTEIDVEVMAVSDLALKVNDGETAAWIPKSALRKTDEGFMNPDDAEPGKSGTICISQKLAEDKGFA